MAVGAGAGQFDDEAVKAEANEMQEFGETALGFEVNDGMPMAMRQTGCSTVGFEGNQKELYGIVNLILMAGDRIAEVQPGGAVKADPEEEAEMTALRAVVAAEGDAAECIRRCSAACVAAARAVARLQEDPAALPGAVARAAAALDQAVQQGRRAEEQHRSRKACAWETACAMVRAGAAGPEEAGPQQPEPYTA
ncbi:unnamed protein product [Prorocentrum cordatum]|uniref:Uncharacterized protein n=1 Tax=Prorocentrum cordatum TaxID=2364126 RepID=A0ABN9RFQ6_9DINO|nr:unnamed protein product [Polarella glacialis]